MARNVTGEVCLDDDEMVTLDFNDGQIIKSGLSNDRKEKFFHRWRGLTTIGYELEAIGEMSA